jgi:hypothetical protein
LRAAAKAVPSFSRIGLSPVKATNFECSFVGSQSLCCMMVFARSTIIS